MKHSSDQIVVRGAREHNLDNVHATLPKNRLICFTGVSGSGKSSLAFDTLFAEGQRRYIESLSTYARQFLGQLPKPDVDQISGLSPAIAIQQKTSGWNPRSTVGTITQIHDYLRVLFARLGIQHCPECDQPISAQSRDQIVERILSGPDGSALTILAPVVRGQKGEFLDFFADMQKSGYVRARVDGRILPIAEVPSLERNRKHDIEIVVDRLTLRNETRPRLAESVDNALRLGDGTLIVLWPSDPDRPSASNPKSVTRNSKSSEWLLSSKYACLRCDRSFEPPTPQMFSFNSPTGMCLNCDGLGSLFTFEPELLVPNPDKSFLQLAIEPMRTEIGRWRRHLYEGVARQVGFDLNTPWRDLPQSARDALLHGTGDAHITYEWKWRGGIWRHGGTFEGVIEELESKYRKARAAPVRAYYEKYMRHQQCPDCHGLRLNEQACHVRLQGLTLPELESRDIPGVLAFLDTLSLTPIHQRIAAEVLKELRGRLQFLMNVGLHYLALNRPAPTLSGGESQRIRLASQIGCGLTGVLYILDEPSVGLHDRDQHQLLESLRHLCNLGNTVIVVEHDEQTMRSADWIVDFGPGPGVRGGRIVAAGTLDEIKGNKKSLTGDYLSFRKTIPVPNRRRPVATRAIHGDQTS